MHSLSDIQRLKSLQEAHAKAKAAWQQTLASHRDDPAFLEELKAASDAYTAAADEHLAFWEPAGPDADANRQDETRAFRHHLDSTAPER